MAQVPSSEQEAAEAAVAALGYKTNTTTNAAAVASGDVEPETVKWNVGCTTDEPYKAFLSVNKVNTGWSIHCTLIPPPQYILLLPPTTLSISYHHSPCVKV